MNKIRFVIRNQHDQDKMMALMDACTLKVSLESYDIPDKQESERLRLRREFLNKED